MLVLVKLVILKLYVGIMLISDCSLYTMAIGGIGEMEAKAFVKKESRFEVQ